MVERCRSDSHFGKGPDCAPTELKFTTEDTEITERYQSRSLRVLRGEYLFGSLWQVPIRHAGQELFELSL